MEVLNLDNNLPQQMKLEDLIKQFSITSRFVQLNWKPVREELQGSTSILGFSHSAPNLLSNTD